MKLQIYPGAREGIALSINNSGQIVGRAGMGDGSYQAALWEKGQMMGLGTLGGSFSEARSINDLGQVAGVATTADGLSHAFLWDKSKMHDLGILNGGMFSSANAINDHGQIVGLADTNQQSHAFLWNQHMVDMGALPGYHGSVATAINARGTIVGSTTLDIDGGAHAFVRNGNYVHTLASLPGLKGSIARDINDEGAVVGYSGSSVRTSRPVLWKDGEVTDLNENAPYHGGMATGINHDGVIVGYYQGKAETRAALWLDGRMADLNLLIPKNSGWTLLMATAINDHGQIVGKGRYSGREIGFLISPTK